MLNKISYISIVLTALASLGLTGCQSTMIRKAPAANPQIVQTLPAVPQQQPRAGRGSLYSESTTVNFFRDLKAYRVGDIVTVNVVESSSASKEAATTLGKDSNISAGISALLGWEYSVPHNQKNAFSPSSMIGAKTAHSFKGSGQTTRKENLTAQISARVVQVLPNGDLAIRGSREVAVNYEKQFIILEGIIRPSDISTDNTVLSSYIADARISYTGKGVVSEKQKPGWMSRILTHVWPF